MDNRRIQKAEKGYVYYCYICKKEYNNIGFFTPIKGCPEYFYCVKCNNTYEASNVKLRRKIIDYCIIT